MSNYTLSTDFTAKDSLISGNPAKLVKGSEISTEFNSVATAIASKVDKTSATGSAQIPAGTQAQRDGSPAAGYVRFNSSSGAFEGFDGTQWGPLGSNNGPVVDVLTYTATAAQTVFTLTTAYTPGQRQVEVFVNGLLMSLTTDYVETDYQTITFNSGLTVGDEVVFRVWRVDTLVDGDAANMSYLPAGTSAVTTTVQAKLRESVSVKDFGAVGDGVTDDTAAFAAALAASKRVYVPNPSVKYLISRPLVLDDDQQLIGESRESCIIEKTTTDLPSPALGTFSGTRSGNAFTYDYDKNAIVIIKKPSGRAYPNGIGIHNITLQGKSGVTVEYGVYTPRLSRSRFTDVYINNVTTGWLTYDTFTCVFERIDVWDVSYGFRWENDGTGVGSGTSCVFIGCGVNFADVYGWLLYGLSYSSITSSFAESIVSGTAGDRPAAWFFNLCKGLVLIGCGSEVVKGYTFRISGGTVDIRGGAFTALTGDTFGSNTGVVFLDSSAKVSIGGGTRFEAVTSPGNIYNEFLSGSGNLLTYDATVTRPSGGTTALVGSGSQIADPSASVAFTPTVAGSTSAGTATYTLQEGYYTRVGNVVYYSIYVAWNTGTGTGNLRINGLPFTVKSMTNPTMGMVNPSGSLTVTAGKFAAAQAIAGTTRLDVVEMPVGTGSVGSCAYSAASSLGITGFYFV